MHQFKDPTRLMRAAIAVVVAYMGARLLFALFSYLEFVSPAPETSGRFAAAALVALAMVILLLLCLVIVGSWIYRVTANAHTLSTEMTISPGWAVGWYFVPFMNLVRPFQGMKETWMASHYRGNWQAEPAPSLLIAWWTLWLAVNILDNVAWRLSPDDGTVTAPVLWLDVIVAVLNVPLCVVLVSMMRQLTRAQLAARHEEVFA